jgi:hypothetical protein
LIRRQSGEFERGQCEEIAELEALFGSEKESVEIAHKRNLTVCDAYRESRERAEV